MSLDQLVITTAFYNNINVRHIKAYIELVATFWLLNKCFCFSSIYHRVRINEHGLTPRPDHVQPGDCEFIFRQDENIQNQNEKTNMVKTVKKIKLFKTRKS